MTSSETTGRTRARPGSAVRLARTIAGSLLVIAGVAIAAGAVRAHRFDAALPDAVDGAPPALGPEIGDDLPFAPFTVAVIDAPCGDHGALDRALRRAQDAGAGVTVVLGDVVPQSSRGLAPLADVMLRYPGVVLLARDTDRAPLDVDERLTSLLLPPEGWDIRTRGCTLRGDGRGVTVRSPVGDREWSIVASESASDDARVELLHLRAEDRAERASVVVERETTVTAAARGVCLDTLWPLASTATGLSGVLAAAFATTLLGLALTRAPGRVPPMRGADQAL